MAVQYFFIRRVPVLLLCALLFVTVPCVLPPSAAAGGGGGGGGSTTFSVKVANTSGTAIKMKGGSATASSMASGGGGHTTQIPAAGVLNPGTTGSYSFQFSKGYSLNSLSIRAEPQLKDSDYLAPIRGSMIYCKSKHANTTCTVRNSDIDAVRNGHHAYPPMN